ncbi:MAG TPA: hypothetical protein PKY96_01525 [Flavobacteriales bacterium]|nr:hypothetical protein [Flavobacteriales bacterium]
MHLLHELGLAQEDLFETFALFVGGHREFRWMPLDNAVNSRIVRRS